MADLVKARELIKQETRFYLSTPERAAEALLFVRELERFASELKDSVKKRATEIMDRDNMEMMEYTITDPQTGEVREWVVRRDYGKQSKEYQPLSAIQALGLERMIPYLKIGKTDFEKMLKIESAKGNITMSQVTEATADPVIKFIKGSGVKLTEVKPKK